MINFDLFNKPFQDIDVRDLARLREVEEGWYVEYKSEVPTVSSIAKSISAFANHYGGWLFYGVMESAEGPKVAASYPGIFCREVQSLQERVRAAATRHIHPTPYFQIRILEGPCPEIGLGDNRCFIVILVSPGADAPYIHNSGRIYRRQADSSEPTHETDRAVLDQLYERSHHKRTRLSEFLEETPKISQAEKGNAYLHIYLFSDPLHDRGHVSSLNFERFTELMRSSRTEDGGISFDNFFSMPRGFIARQVISNDPYLQLLTWRHYFDNTSTLTVPLNLGKIDTEFENYLRERYIFADHLIQRLCQGSLSSSRILDLNLIPTVMTSAIRRYRCLSAESRIKEPFYFKAFLENIWRCAPFIDTETYQKFLDEHGIPIIQDSSTFAPPGKKPETLIKIEEEKEEPFNGVNGLAPLISAMPSVVEVFKVLGIPISVVVESIKNRGDLLKASQRALGRRDCDGKDRGEVSV